MEQRKYMTQPEVAEYIGVSVATIRNWMRDREFPCLRVNHSVVRFDRDQVDAWMRDQGERSKAEPAGAAR